MTSETCPAGDACTCSAGSGTRSWPASASISGSATGARVPAPTGSAAVWIFAPTRTPEPSIQISFKSSSHFQELLDVLPAKTKPWACASADFCFRKCFRNRTKLLRRCCYFWLPLSRIWLRSDLICIKFTKKLHKIYIKFTKKFQKKLHKYPKKLYKICIKFA